MDQGPIDLSLKQGILYVYRLKKREHNFEVRVGREIYEAGGIYY